MREPRILPPSYWAFEIKLGPYYPDIDGESGLTSAPYATVFGTGKSLLPQLELDRFFFHLGGELGIGASIGFMSNTDRALEEDTNGQAKIKSGTTACGVDNDTTADGAYCRTGDETSFNLIPMSLLLVYRFTLLADRTVIPLVPYAKFGLSYYIWRFTRGDGGVASAKGQDGLGGTFGWQAALGLTFRAESLDHEAARNMENDLGIEHVGLFVEMTYADVSGLGMSNRLHVGDFTWNAGINFEF